MLRVSSMMDKKRRSHILTLLFVFSFFYIVYPLYGEPSMFIYILCLVGYIVGAYCFFKIKNKTNYFDFDVLFIFIYGLVAYSTTPFYYNESLYKALFVGYFFDVKYVNAGNVLSTIGILAYFWGGISIRTKNSKYQVKPLIRTRGMSVLLLILTLLFVVMGGRAYSQSAYNEGAGSYSGLIPYILLFLTYLSIVIITTELYNKKFHHSYIIDRLSIISIIIVSLILLTGGSRSDASNIALPVIGVYTMLLSPMKLKRTMLFLLFGIIVMWVIGKVRTGDVVSEVANPVLTLIDLTVPSRSNYAVFEYVTDKGFSYGSSFVGLFTVIPFLSSATGMTEGSAELLTTSFIDNNPGYPIIGLGTTVIADIYIAFGFIGVLTIMYILGRFVNRSFVGASELNYYSLITYAALLSISVFIVRGSCTLPIRPVIWCLVIAHINYKMQLSQNK